MTTHSCPRVGSDPSIAASTLRSVTVRLTTDAVTVTRTPGIATGGDPRGLSDSRARSARDLPPPRTRLSASATEIWPTGIVTRSAHAASVYGSRRGGCAGQYARDAVANSVGPW